MTYTYRAATMDDMSALHALIVRAEQFDSVPRVLELDELVEELSSEAVDLAANSMVAAHDDEIVGYVSVFHRRSETSEQRCVIDGVVAPEHRGQGIGRVLLGFAVERGTDVLRSIDDDLPKYIRLHAYDHQAETHRLAARFGFQPVRYFDDLLRPLTDLPDRTGVDGITILPWPDDRDEELRVVKNTAFLDHWGSPSTPSDLWHEQLHGYGSRRDLSFIAVDTDIGDVVALLVSARYEADDELLGRRDAWIQTLATLRPWRGRGLGSALIVEALHAYLAAGLTHASIDVDSENLSGAAQLYRSLGFELAHRTIAHRLTVT